MVISGLVSCLNNPIDEIFFLYVIVAAIYLIFRSMYIICKIPTLFSIYLLPLFISHLSLMFALPAVCL